MGYRNPPTFLSGTGLLYQKMISERTEYEASKTAIERDNITPAIKDANALSFPRRRESSALQ
jgi:hypothetical protein